MDISIMTDRVGTPAGHTRAPGCSPCVAPPDRNRTLGGSVDEVVMS